MTLNRVLATVVGLLLAVLLPTVARADATAGEQLARRWCVNCHVIDATGPATTLPQGPPSFRTITGHLNPEQIRTFLTRPHGAMPDLALTRAEIDDLLAYIESLK